MSRIRSSGSKPELVLRAVVRRASGGLSLRYNYSGLPGSPDIVVFSLKLAIFMEGCFWHGCPEHGRVPKSNVDFWRKKLARNKRRDRRNRALLRELGWTVWRVWEHDLKPDRLVRTGRNLRRRFRRLSGA
jgi:DNA mismatch endonuclease (patch repair protein)